MNRHTSIIKARCGEEKRGGRKEKEKRGRTLGRKMEKEKERGRRGKGRAGRMENSRNVDDSTA